MTTLRIEIFSRRKLLGKRWYFRVVHMNGKTVAQSEGYFNKVDAIATAQELRGGLFDAEIVSE